jgi:uncharacterized damage-inducible protein DinB
MFASATRTLYDYNAWANARVLDASAHLTDEQFLGKIEGGYGSLRDTLVHIVDAEWMYLERWRGRSPNSVWDPNAFPSVSSIHEKWTSVAAETRAFVNDLDDASLERVVSYVNTQGETWAYPLWQQMHHQVNHATQHRSEVAIQLTRYGHSPGWLDYLLFIDEQGAATGV